MTILIQKVAAVHVDTAFLPCSSVRPRLLVHGPHSEQQRIRRAQWEVRSRSKGLGWQQDGQWGRGESLGAGGWGPRGGVDPAVDTAPQMAMRVIMNMVCQGHTDPEMGQNFSQPGNSHIPPVWWVDRNWLLGGMVHSEAGKSGCAATPCIGRATQGGKVSWRRDLQGEQVFSIPALAVSDPVAFRATRVANCLRA